MKALDTSVLLALLEGDRSVRELLRRLRGVEVATTEANFLELAYLAAHGPSRVRKRRREALARLRQKLTVLPIDPRAVAEAESALLSGEAPASPLLVGMLGALEAEGCDELYTADTKDFKGRWRFQLSKFTIHKPK